MIIKGGQETGKFILQDTVIYRVFYTVPFHARSSLACLVIRAQVEHLVNKLVMWGFLFFNGLSQFTMLIFISAFKRDPVKS